MSRSAGEKIFQFSWEILGRDLKGFVSSKAVPEVLDRKDKSECKHGFTNRGCLHCAILKALHGFPKKRALKLRNMEFFLQNVQNEIFKIFKVFKNSMKFSRAAC